MTVDQPSIPNVNTPDYDAIVEAVDLYIDGFDGKVHKFAECFHPDARITFTDAAGKLLSLPISDCFADWATSGPWQRRILSVTQAGDVACVMLQMHRGLPNEENSWVDIHSLLRINGRWTDMNKTATHTSRAGWAASDAW